MESAPHISLAGALANQRGPSSASSTFRDNLLAPSPLRPILCTLPARDILLLDMPPDSLSSPGATATLARKSRGAYRARTSSPNGRSVQAERYIGCTMGNVRVGDRPYKTIILPFHAPSPCPPPLYFAPVRCIKQVLIDISRKCMLSFRTLGEGYLEIKCR